MMRRIIILAGIVSVIAGSFMLGVVYADGPPEAPMEYGRGFTPLPFEHHGVSVRQPLHASALAFPVRFDWRESGYVTPVKQQGSCGACYTFAGLGDFESKLLMAGEGSFDFSENNLKECEWFGRNGLQPSGCAGGTYWRIINLMAEKGTVMESCDPYLPYKTGCKTACSYIKTVLDWRVFTTNQVPSPDLMKTYLTTQGPIFVAIDGGIGSAWRNELNNYDGSYTFYNPSSTTVNHAVLIVGWDDTLSHEGGQGAWICKNSWGTNWGGTAGYGTEKGYFTIAYGSAQIGWYSSFVKGWKDFDPCDRLLFYDEAGFYSTTGYSGVKTAWAMCKFIASESMTLDRVEFWTTDATTDVDIYVYDDFNGTSLSNLLASVEDTSFTEMGYHSVALPSPVLMSVDQDFYVAVKIKNVSYLNLPLTMDPSFIGPRAPGRCYKSATGVDWSECLDGDLGVRARMNLTRDCEPPEGVSSFSAAAGESDIVLRWTNPADGDFSHTLIRYSAAKYPLTSEDGTPVNNGMDGLFYNSPASADSFTHTGRSIDVTYYYSAFSADTLDNYSLAVNAAATPGDTLAPDSVYQFTADSNDRMVKLNWTAPDDDDLTGVLIRYSTDSPPGLLGSGAPVENGNSGVFAATPAAQDSFIHDGLINGETYYYCIWAFDASSNYSGSRCLEAVPVDLMPPNFSVSVFQNPYLTNHLDIYVIASEPVVEESFVVTIEGVDESHESVPGQSRAVRCDYDVYESGELNVRACATDLNSNSGCDEKAYAVSKLLARSGGVAGSLDGLMRLEVGDNALGGDTFVLISTTSATQVSGTGGGGGSGGNDSRGSLYKASPAALELADPATISIAYSGIKVAPEHLTIARVEDGSISPMESYVDRDSGRIIAHVDRLGTFGLLEVPDVETPDYGGQELKLMQNVPNPFAGTTKISFSLPRASQVRVDVVTVEGRMVSTLIDEHAGPGIHHIDWDATDASGQSVAGGIYFYRIVTPEATATRKMVFLR